MRLPRQRFPPVFLRRSVRVLIAATQQRMITLLAAGIAYVISQQVTNRLIDIPEQRGIKDDILEAVLKGATTATSTVLASILVRRLFRD